VEEGELLPESIILPDLPAGNVMKIGLLGCNRKLTIKFKEGKKIVMIPESFRQQMASTPAFVFVVK
jgi:hypothetical protein